MVVKGGFKVRVKGCESEACGYRCQEVCPCGVFLAVPRSRDRRRHAARPRYRIVPRFRELCDGCRECVEVCPQGAIRVWR